MIGLLVAVLCLSFWGDFDWVEGWAVSEVRVGGVTTTSSSFAHLSSFTFLSALASVLVRGVKVGCVIAEVLLILCQVVELKVGVLLKASIGVELHHTSKGKGPSSCLSVHPACTES